MSDVDFEEISRAFSDMMLEFEDQEESTWKSLDYETQLDVFCSVIRRLHNAELVEGRSYRGVLYDSFEFGAEAYTRAQCAGFLDIHNSLYSKKEITQVLLNFNKHFNINLSEEEILNYVKGNHL